MIRRFRGRSKIQTNEEIKNFKSEWNKNQLIIEIVDFKKFPIDFDFTFIDQIVIQKGGNLEKNIPNKFYQVNNNIYQRYLVSCILTGGLGNRLFQLSVALWYAKLTEKTAVIALNQEKECLHSSIPYRKTIFQNLPIIDQFPSNTVVYREKQDEFSIFKQWPSRQNKHVLFHGYFQSYLYVQPFMFSYFTLPTTSTTTINSFIHVRRGDYLKHTLYLKISRLYYMECLHQFRLKIPQSKFIVVSDDINWCKRQEIFISNDIHFDTESKNELETLSILSKCFHGSICSNSTFAWWGTWFAEQTKKSSILKFLPSKWLNNDWKTQYAIKNEQTFLISNEPDQNFLSIFNSLDDFLQSNQVYGMIVDSNYKPDLFLLKNFFKRNFSFEILILTQNPTEIFLINNNNFPKKTSISTFLPINFIATRKGATKMKEHAIINEAFILL